MTVHLPQSYTILGCEVSLPVEVRDASAAVAYYLVPSRAAQRLIDASGLRIASIFPGRTICTIGVMDYKDNDLGPYHEIAVTFFVRERGQRALPLIGTALGLLRGGLGAYIHRLPVDGEFTCEAGRQIWGFPKFMSEIALMREGDRETAVLRVDGQHVLTQTMQTGGARSMPERAQVSYALRDGVVYRTPSTMGGEAMGARRGGATLELGSHALADELRPLGLPKKPIFSTYIGKMRGVFYAAERIT